MLKVHFQDNGSMEKLSKRLDLRFIGCNNSLLKNKDRLLGRDENKL
jgi:hypothetical protein